VALGGVLAAVAVILLVTPFGFEAWELAPLLIGIGVALWRSNPPRNLLPPTHPTKSGDFAGTPVLHPVLAGNTCLYGATAGRLFLAGRAGERFGVRNSGAVAVVEGTGDHLCEYMTGGVVVALGPVGWNVGAGMTGGVAYIREWGQLNADSVLLRAVPGEDAEQLRELVEEHHGRTGSRLAAKLLSDWPRALKGFRQVVPVAAVAPAAAPEAAAEATTARA